MTAPTNPETILHEPPSTSASLLTSMRLMAAAGYRVWGRPHDYGQALTAMIGRPYETMSELSVGVMPPKQCFQNANRLAASHARFTYCEGFAVTLSLGLPMHHAWVLDDNGAVMEPTWNQEWHKDGVLYVGVPFTSKEVDALTYRYGCYDLLYSILGEGKMLEHVEAAAAGWSQGENL